MVFLGLTQCTKDETPAATSVEFNTTNVAGTYKLSAVVFIPSGSTLEIDAFSLFPACQKDDTFSFSAAGSFTLTDAGTQCSPIGGFTGPFTITTTPTKTITYRGQTYDVQSFTSTTLVISYATSGVYNGITVNGVQKLTLTRQ